MQLAKFAGRFEHTVIDTKARPDEKDLKVLATGCDLLVIPTTPDAMSLKATLKMLSALSDLEANAYKILLTMIPPPPSHDGADAAATLKEKNCQFSNRRFVATPLIKKPLFTARSYETQKTITPPKRGAIIKNSERRFYADEQ